MIFRVRRKAYPSGRLGQPRRVAARLSGGARVPGSRGFGTDPSLATLGKVPQTGLSSKTKRTGEFASVKCSGAAGGGEGHSYLRVR